jgi:hypothetical protein
LARGTFTSKIAPEPQDPEQAAQAKLKLAKMLARDGLAEKARTHYQEIIQQYPKTKAGPARLGATSCSCDIEFCDSRSCSEAPGGGEG